MKWTLLAFCIALILAGCFAIVRTYRNRPDRKLARKIRKCAKEIQELLGVIEREEAWHRRVQMPEYADHLRVNGWRESVIADTGVFDYDTGRTRFKTAKNEKEIQQHVAYLVAKSQEFITERQSRLEGLVQVYRGLMEEYQRQNETFDVSDQLRRQLADKERKLETLRTMTTRVQTERDLLKQELERLDGRALTYREGTMKRQPIKVRVAPEVAEVEALLQEYEAKKTATSRQTHPVPQYCGTGCFLFETYKTPDEGRRFCLISLVLILHLVLCKYTNLKFFRCQIFRLRAGEGNRTPVSRLETKRYLICQDASRRGRRLG